MGVTNPTPVAGIAFSRNELKLELQSADYLAAAAAKSVNFLEFDSAVAADAEFDLSWAIGAANMVAKVAPDDSGMQFPAGDGSNGYVTSLLPWFQGNYFIGRDFMVTTDFGGAHPRLIFTAVAESPDYDFTDTDGGAAGVITPGATDQPKTNFAHHLELYIGTDFDGAEYERAFDANIPLDYPLTSKSVTDVHDELHPFLASDRPELVNPYALCKSSIRPCYFKFAQFFGDTPFVRKGQKSSIFYVNKGGLSKQAAYARDILAELNPVPLDATKIRFLRQGSINKLVAVDQPEWLTWINFLDAEADIVLEVKIYNDDASVFTFNATDAIAAAKYQKIQFPVGYAQLSIATRQAGKTPVYYTVAVKHGADYVSQTAAFVIDNTYFEFPRYFVYENSYGAFQTIATVGKGQSEADRTKVDNQMAVDQLTAAISGDFLESDIYIQDKNTVNIGYKRSDRRNTTLLRDFLLSETKFIWSAGASNPLVPIGLITQNIKDWPDGANIDADQIEYYPLYPEQVFSEEPGLSDDAIAQLLIDAGNNIAIGADSGYFYVKAGDARIGVDGDGNFEVTDARLVGKTGYTVYATQLSAVIRPPKITYNLIAGSFSIIIEGFAVAPDFPLIVFQNNIDVL